MSMSRRLIGVGLAVLVAAAPVAQGRACGFEDPNSASMQRVRLSLVYPNALYVQGAVDTALRDGVLKPAHFIRPGDFFALQHTTRNLRQFAETFATGEPGSTLGFSMLLMGPVLWTRFQKDGEGIVVEPHVAGPLAGRAVIVTDVPALAALVTGDISGAYANASGLVRYYGAADEVRILRDAMAAAFSGGDHAGLRTFERPTTVR